MILGGSGSTSLKKREPTNKISASCPEETTSEANLRVLPTSVRNLSSRRREFTLKFGSNLELEGLAITSVGIKSKKVENVCVQIIFETVKAKIREDKLTGRFH